MHLFKCPGSPGTLPSCWGRRTLISPARAVNRFGLRKSAPCRGVELGAMTAGVSFRGVTILGNMSLRTAFSNAPHQMTKGHSRCDNVWRMEAAVIGGSSPSTPDL